MQFGDAELSEYEMLLDGIEFARAELGIDDSEIPASLAEIRRLRDEFVSRLKPPTPARLNELEWLVSKTGGTFHGSLTKGAAAQLLINHLREVELPKHRRTNVLDGEETDADERKSDYGFL